MSYININGKKYKVIEDLGFQGGYSAKVVEDLSLLPKEQIVVKESGKWRLWTIHDRIRS